MSEKIMLIDGHSILNRAFYGLPDLTNSEGLHTNAIYGFLTMMFRFIEEEKPDYLAVAFDLSAPTFRHEMFDAYKGTRKPMMEELRQQVPVMKEVLRSMTIPIISQEGLEADDLLGTLSKRGEAKGYDVTIISGDRDLLQLATEKVKIRIPKTRMGKTEVEDYYAKDVVHKYSVTPTEFIDLKALMGDSSDNIPGVPSIGEKTATKIITAYHSIEAAYENVDEIKPPRASKALKEHWDLAVISKKLAKICVDADFNFSFEEARMGNIYTPEAYVYFQRLQFKNLLSRFEVQECALNLEESFKEIHTKKEAEDVFRLAENQAYISLSFYKNTENVLPLFAMDATLGGIVVGLDDKSVFRMDFEHDITIEWVGEKLQDLAQNHKVQMVLFDLKKWFEYLPELSCDCFFDVLIAAYLLNPLNSNYAIADVAQEYLQITLDEKSDLFSYYEAYVLNALLPKLDERLKEYGMMNLYKDIEMPLVKVLYSMEQYGVRADGKALKEYGDNLLEEIKNLESEIYQLSGETFNINSPKQLGVILFEKLGIKGGKKTKTGYSTAADVLEKLAGDYPVINKILRYRTLTKLKSTYADGLANFIGDDQRIHGKFHQTITATGRLSSSDPNLQNIPIRLDLGRLIRKVFVPEDGYIFVDADYSQIELRILAHCSGDEQLIEAFKNKEDIHRSTASKVFHIPFDEVTPLQRRNAKAVNFGIVYGISSFGLAEDLNISRKEAASYIEQYFETYPGIKAFLDGCVEKAKTDGYVETIYGRRRPLPEIKSGNFNQRSFGERVAMNAPIQGAAADIMKIAMIKVFDRMHSLRLKSKLVLQIHDELLIEAKLDELETVKTIMTEEMINAANLLVPLEIDMHEGSTWYDAK